MPHYIDPSSLGEDIVLGCRHYKGWLDRIDRGNDNDRTPCSFLTHMNPVLLDCAHHSILREGRSDSDVQPLSLTKFYDDFAGWVLAVEAFETTLKSYFASRARSWRQNVAAGTKADWWNYLVRDCDFYNMFRKVRRCCVSFLKRFPEAYLTNFEEELVICTGFNGETAVKLLGPLNQRFGTGVDFDNLQTLMRDIIGLPFGIGIAASDYDAFALPPAVKSLLTSGLGSKVSYRFMFSHPFFWDDENCHGCVFIRNLYDAIRFSLFDADFNQCFSVELSPVYWNGKLDAFQALSKVYHDRDKGPYNEHDILETIRFFFNVYYDYNDHSIEKRDRIYIQRELSSLVPNVHVMLFEGLLEYASQTAMYKADGTLNQVFPKFFQKDISTEFVL